MNIILETQITDQDRESLRSKLREFNQKHAQPENHQDFMLIIKNDKGELQGGILCDTYWDWLHIDTLWLAEEFRNQGYGNKLLVAAEAEAKKRGCQNSHLETHDFQALDFYKKNGYEVCGQLDDLPQGYNRYLLKKHL